jgi:hypothetical protein
MTKGVGLEMLGDWWRYIGNPNAKIQMPNKAQNTNDKKREAALTVQAE